MTSGKSSESKNEITGGVKIRRVRFAVLRQTKLVVDVETGEEIEGFTEADLRALELLDLYNRYELASRNRLKSKYGYEHHQCLRHVMSEYYSNVATHHLNPYDSKARRRYKNYKDYSLRELATRGFTYEFYEKVVVDFLNFSKVEEKKLEEWDEKSIAHYRCKRKFIKDDLMSVGRGDRRVRDLANKV